MDTETVRVVDCSSSDLQRWIVEPIGQTITTQVRQIFNEQRQSCLEPDGTNLNVTRWLRPWPCSGAARPLQAFLALNNGQLRPMANMARCVAVENNTNRNLRIEGCSSTESRHRWVIDIDSDKLISLANGRMETQNTGNGRCVRAEEDWGETRLHTCPSPLTENFEWTLEPVAAGSRTFQLRNEATDGCMERQGNGKSVLWPCSGADRATQSLVLTSAKQIRDLGGTRCLWWSGGDAEWFDCDRTWTAYGQWNLNTDKTVRSQQDSSKCLQAGEHTDTIKVVNCDTGNARQRWISEPISARDNSLPMQIRNRRYNSCLDFPGLPSYGHALPDQYREVPVARTVACVGQSRVNQGFIQLSNGQFRTMANLDYCLDSRNPSGTDATTLGAWIQPCDNVNQQMWEMPQINQRMRTKATYGGSQRSLQAGANGSPTSKAPDNVLADPDQDAQRWIIEDQPS